MLRILIKLVVAAAIVILSLVILGDYLRQLVPEPYHRAVWKTGLFIFFPCAIGVALVAAYLPAKPRRFENVLMVGAVIGALLFILFISDLDCTLTPAGRGGSRLSCRYLGEP